MRRFAVPLALIGAACAATVLAFELLLRLIGFSAPIWHQPDRVLGWTLRPGLAAWYSGEGRSFVSVNAAGMRDREHALDKPPGVYRIAVLGDSYAEAKQVAADEAFWARLPAALERCGFAPGRRFEVLNFGVSGWGTAQQYAALESMAMRYQPDLVLLQFTNGNDVRNNSLALEEQKERPFLLLDPGGRLRMDDSFTASPAFRKHSSLAYELLRQLSDHSRVVQLVREAQRAPLFRSAHADADGFEQGLERQVLAAPREPLWEQAWQITEALIAKSAEYARRNGAQFLVVTVPYAIQVHPDPAVRAALQAKLGVADLYYPDRRIAQFARRNGIDALALAPAMQPLAERREAWFHGFPETGFGRGHWNAEGHLAAAALIAEHLCAPGSERLWASGSPTSR